MGKKNNQRADTGLDRESAQLAIAIYAHTLVIKSTHETKKGALYYTRTLFLQLYSCSAYYQYQPLAFSAITHLQEIIRQVDVTFIPDTSHC